MTVLTQFRLGRGEGEGGREGGREGGKEGEIDRGKEEEGKVNRSIFTVVIHMLTPY